MDLRREKQKGNRIIGMLSVLVLCSVAAIAISLFGNSVATPAITFPKIEGGDSAAVPLPSNQLKPAAKNAEKDFSYIINSTPVFNNSTAKGDLTLQNPIVNQHLMVVELVLDSTGEVIYRSGYIQPGQQILSAALDTELEAGNYEVTAHICAIDSQSEDLLGILEQAVSLTIKK